MPQADTIHFFNLLLDFYSILLLTFIIIVSYNNFSIVYLIKGINTNIAFKK